MQKVRSRICGAGKKVIKTRNENSDLNLLKYIQYIYMSCYILIVYKKWGKLQICAAWEIRQTLTFRGIFEKISLAHCFW